MQNFYQGVVAEFLNSNHCRDRISYTAILALIKNDKLLNNINGYLSVDGLLIFAEQEAYVEAVVRDIDNILHGVFVRCKEQGVSALSYISKSISENKEKADNPFLMHENRREGVVYETMLATALYGNELNEGKKIIAGDAAIISAVADTLILELAASFKEWLRLSAADNEKYKLIAKYKNAQISISQEYIVSLFDVVGIDKLNDKSRLAAELEVGDIADNFEVSNQEMAQIGIQYRDDLLIAIYNSIDEKDGVFKSIASHTYFDNITLEGPSFNREIQVARNFQKASISDVEFWSFLSSWSLKAISQAYNKYKNTQRADIPPPPIAR